MRGGNARVSDRDQPNFSANFTALETDCRHLRSNDMVQVYYADYKIEAITRAPGSKGLVTLACSATQSSQVVPGLDTPMTFEDGTTMAHEDSSAMLYEDGSTPAITNNHS